MTEDVVAVERAADNRVALPEAEDWSDPLEEP